MEPEKIDYRVLRPARSADHPDAMALLLAALVFWLTHVVCEACVGYFYFVYFPLRAVTAGGVASPRTQRLWDRWLVSTIIDAKIALAGAAALFALPFVIWLTGWMQLRRRIAARAAACGVVFCLTRWGLEYFLEWRRSPLAHRDDFDFWISLFLAAALSMCLLVDERRPV